MSNKYKNENTIWKFNFTIGFTEQPDRVLYRLGSGCVDVHFGKVPTGDKGCLTEDWLVVSLL